MKRLRFLPLAVVVTLLCLSLFSSVQAQTDLGSTYVTSDGSFRFHYPGGWSPYVLPDGTFSAGDNVVSVLVIAPEQLPKFGVTVTKGMTVEQVLSKYIDFNQGVLQFEAVKPIKLRPNLVAARADLTSTDSRYASITSAFALVVPVGNTFAVLIAFGVGVDFAYLEPAVYPVALNFEVGIFETAGAVRGDLPILVHYNEGDPGKNWQNSVAELEALKLIPPDGTLIFSRDRLEVGSARAFGFDDQTASAYTDYVAGGLMSFQSDKVVDGAGAICGLATRGTESVNGNPASYLIVVATSGGTVLVVNKSASEYDPFIFQTNDVAKFSEPQHLLYIVRGGQVTVFLNGKAIIENLTLKFPPDPAQTWLTGISMDPGCVMTGVWVYGLPSQASQATPEATSDAAVSR